MCSKKKFNDLENVIRFLYLAKRQREIGNIRRKEISYYKCPECHYWHVTSRKHGAKTWIKTINSATPTVTIL